MRCPQCQHENRAGRRFCAPCGAALDVSCLACAFVNEAGDTFCGGCGAALAGPILSSSVARVVQRETETEVRFHAILPVLTGLLQREGRVTYRTLIQAFGLDEVLLGHLREDLILRRLAIDDAGKVLVWTGAPANEPAAPPAATSTDAAPDEPVVVSEPVRVAPEAERRQLTVMFCDLADSTKLSQQLDPW